MDFESHSKSHNEHWLITRDMLAFLYSLCRVKGLDDEKLGELFDYYKSHCPTIYWADMLSYMRRFRWLYYLYFRLNQLLERIYWPFIGYLNI